MATLNGIDLGNNALWSNEFEGSAIDRETKYTEDGRQYVFQKPKQKFRKLVYDCKDEWLPYSTIKQLAALRDSGQPATFVHNDSRVFTVLLESIEGAPLINRSQYSDTAKFRIILRFMEI